MGCLLFDGSDDKLKWSTLTAPLQNASNGAWTMAFVLKRVGPGVTRALSYLLSGSGTGTAVAGLSFNASSFPLVDVGAGAATPSQLTDVTSPYLLVISKGAGTVVPRLGWKLGSGGTWTHEDSPSTLADQAAATMLEIGTWEAVDFFSGWIGVVAIWEGAMSDANKAALDDNWRTSDFYASAHGTPVFLAELNVAGASVVDLIGNASSLVATGLTLDAGETLESWNFDGLGSGASAVLTGTAVGGIAEADLVAGGRTIVITLSGDTFLAN